jgi:hypothetical protein
MKYFLLYLWRMVKVSIELSEKAHQRILDIQLERRKAKKEPSALNKIASEIINEVLEKENPDK